MAAPKYERIAGTLRARIRRGDLPPGTRLASEAVMKEEFGVSYSTVRSAMELLEAEGVIERQHGRGTFVKTARQRVHRTTDRYQWEKDRVSLPEEERRYEGSAERDTGLTYDDFVFSAKYDDVEADKDLATAFDCPEGTPLLRRIYKTRKKSELAPLAIGISYLVRSMIEANPMLLKEENEPWPGATQHQLSTVGIELDYIIDEVISRPATAEESEELAIPPGTAAVCLRKISVDTTGRVVEVNDVTWPGDRIKLSYRTNLELWTK